MYVVLIMKKEKMLITISGVSIFLASSLYYLFKTKSISDSLINSLGIMILVIISLIIVWLVQKKGE